MCWSLLSLYLDAVACLVSFCGCQSIGTALLSTFPFYLPANRGIREWLLVWMLIVDHCPTNFLLQHPLSIENERTPDDLLHWLRYYCALIWLYYYCKIICRRQTTIGLSSAALEIEHNRRPILFVFVFFLNQHRPCWYRPALVNDWSIHRLRLALRHLLFELGKECKADWVCTAISNHAPRLNLTALLLIFILQYTEHSCFQSDWII